MKPFILASQSPRRKQLLEQVHIPFFVEESRVVEQFNMEESPEEVVVSLASQKAEEVFSRFPDHVVLGADTIVVVDQDVLGKPHDEKEAKEMLRRLSGRTHHVMTGVSIISNEKKLSFCEIAQVTFFELTEEEISAYVHTGDPFDKAGGYGIQTNGATLVHSIRGDYFTIVGLPIARVVRALKKEFQIISDLN
ncbi:Maf family protein [Evansella sp. AB-P1]|uniref:Maf family protein n=1 Tax=Evansella sp. AB-P1 TaxID=3037653 RepID=UPI00241DB948|nr:Maf family protein [Evansella sp. AB-P1]MDG5786854.1 Maf family protein [Evansella sp. AB-P1]